MLVNTHFTAVWKLNVLLCGAKIAFEIMYHLLNLTYNVKG